MQWLANLSVRRPVLSSVIIMVIVVIGAVSFMDLGVDKFPKAEFPFVTITTIYPGSSPEAVETDITDKIEAAVNTIGGIDSLISVSNESVSLVMVRFDMDRDIDTAAQDVRDKLALISADLPGDVDPPTVQKVDPDEAPILMVSLTGDQDAVELTRIAEDIVKRRLETINGVGEVTIVGGRKRRINVLLDPVRMRALSVSALEVQGAVASSNSDIPGGQLESGASNRTIRFAGRAEDPKELENIVVRQSGNHPIFLRDVATVEDGAEELESIAQRDGVSTIVLAVRKQSGSNTVEVVKNAKKAMDRMLSEGQLPGDTSLEIVRDNSESIQASIDTVLEHLVLGGFLAALVVLIFLGDLRSTVISAISIPVSLVGTFFLMDLAGFTLDLMTLLALALAVGIVIDDSIIVLENIHRFISEKGMKPFPAAILATKEIGPAVLATTLSLLAIFLPISFMGGIPGQFLRSFGLTMSFAIFVSVIVSFTIVPMLSARVLPPKESAEQRTPFLKRLVDWFYSPIQAVYMMILRFSMRFRFLIVAISVGILFTVPVLVEKAGANFLPISDDAQFEVYIETKTGSSIDETSVIAERAARLTRELPYVKYTLLTVGDGKQQESNVGHVYVRLENPEVRLETTQEDLMEMARKNLDGVFPEDVEVTIMPVGDISFGGKSLSIQFTIQGPELDVLEVISDQLMAELKKVPGVVDASTTVKAPTPEVKMTPDFARAAALGVSPIDIAMTLRLFVEGQDTSKYQEGNLQYEVYVQGDKAYRIDKAALEPLMVPSRLLGQVPLLDVVSIEESEGPSAINRLDRARQVTIGSNVAKGYNQGAVVEEFQKVVESLNLPAGYSARPIGQAEEMGKMQAEFALAFFLAFLFMYLVLAAQFESWLHPFTILLSLPITFPFALLGLILFGQQLNMFSLLGLLVLFGMVKKNAILQIDHTNQLRAQGWDRYDAIMQANKDRLRPILMTTIAFVAGMMPLVLSKGIGSGMSRAMATIVVGGQSLSLLLTLVAIPVFYSLFDDAGQLLGKFLGLFKKGEALDRGRSEVFKAPSEDLLA